MKLSVKPYLLPYGALVMSLCLPMLAHTENIETPEYIKPGVISYVEEAPKSPLSIGSGTVYKRVRTNKIKPSADTAQTQISAPQALGDIALAEKIMPEKTAQAQAAPQKTLPNQEIKPSTMANMPEVSPPPAAQTKPVIITYGNTGREQQLLNQAKAKKHLAMNELGLSPNERLVPNQGLMPNERMIAPQSQPKVQQEKAGINARNKADDTIIDKLEFNQANMLDVARALADISGLNFVATEEAAKKNVTVFLQKISVKNALDAITKNTGLWYRQDKESGTFRIMSTDEYQRDMVVYREDTTRVFNLLNHNPILVGTAIKDLYGARVVLSFGSNYDDFNTGQFNSGGGGNNQNGGGNRNGGANLSGGQNNMRRTVTTGTSGGNARQLNTGGGTTGAIDEKTTGTSGNGAITEKLTADQIAKLEKALTVDEDGNLIASDAVRGITKSQQPIYVTLSSQQNMMIVRTSDTSAVREIENLVKAMDKPTTQVLLEMRILEVDVGDAYTQLFSFSAASKNGKHSATGVQDTKLTGTGKFVYSFVDSLINARLEILEKNNQAKTVSSPLLMASNNRTARLFVGEERLLIRGATLTDPVFNPVGGGILIPGRLTYETEIRNIGDTLNITPKINADGTVTLGIFQDTSTVNPRSVQFPPIGFTNSEPINFSIDTVLTSNIEGVVVAQDGLTVAIGGLIRTTNSKMESKIPILSDIPVIGGVFKDRQNVVSRKEMVLLITPHIINVPAEGDDISRDAIEPISVQEW